MLSSVEARIATVDDAAAVAAVHVRSWQDAYRGIFPDAYLDGLSVERRSNVWSHGPSGAPAGAGRGSEARSHS
jgi:hypothetical protein